MSIKIKTLPRWLVFLFDLFCVVVAITLSRVVRNNFQLDLAFTNLGNVLALALPINAALFYIFRSYAGIIRYTAIRDTLRLLGIVGVSSVVYAFLSAAYYDSGIFPLSYAAILINVFVLTSGLIGYRMLVRYCYKAFFTDALQKDADKAVVFDSSEEGLQTKRVINDNPVHHINVVGFLDDRPRTIGKRMEGLPIYLVNENTFKRLEKEKVSQVIVSKTMSPERLNPLVDLSLKYGMRLRQVPPLSKWLNGKLASEQLKDVPIEDLLEREVINIKNENILRALNGKKVLITGAAGSIGSEIVRQVLRYNPALVILCDKAETPMHELSLEVSEKWAEIPTKFYIGDICDWQRMEHLFEIYDPEIVFHAAAYKHVPLMEENPSVAVMNNVLGTRNLAELSVIFGVEKFVMVSTDKAVNPTNVMGASKRICEIFIQSLSRHIRKGESNMPEGSKKATSFVTTRFGNVLGSNGSVIPRFKKQIEAGGPVTVTHPDITRFFMTIPEACQLVIEAGVMGSGGEIFVFDMGEPVKVADLAEKMIRLSGKQPGIDVHITFTGLRPGEKLYEELLSRSENTLPTYHNKIMIAQVRQYDFELVNGKIQELIDVAKMHYTNETVLKMKELVPEFISKNSAFESLDVKA